MRYYLAIDIGASSGRHIVGWMENGEVKTEEVYRFPNGVKEQNGSLTWDTEELFRNVVEGIRRANEQFGKIESLAIDTWGVDYVLLRGAEEVMPCYAYRDDRTAGPIEKVHAIIPFEELYMHTGIQFQTFNTIYQLYDDLEKGRLEGVTDFLMLPEYLSYRLTGVKKHEYTEASTSGLLCAETGLFDMEIVDRLGLPRHLFYAPSKPGTSLGLLKPEVAERVGGQAEVVLCASHDTASAVEWIPMEDDNPYISSGTWSLFGIKSARPICNQASLKANYTNEGGVGYIRLLKNIMGMWVVQSLRRDLCPEKDYGTIAAEAETSTYSETVDVNAEVFMAPPCMKQAFDDYLAGQGKPLPQTEQDYFNCAFHSLAKIYAVSLAELETVVGKKYDKLYIVGGGAKNNYLNRLTEAACKVKVVALPVEATALGNLKIQMNRGE